MCIRDRTMGKAGRGGAKRGAGACRMLAGVHRSEPIVYNSVLCEYEAPFDGNGVLYFIATAGGTRAWVNPHLSGDVVAAMWRQQRAHCSPDRFVLHPVSYTHLRAHETVLDLVCRLLLEKKKKLKERQC
eukprot:TRINITY_DN15546_c0_g1_i4.p1 TRINITY_DN15546_c0_g1~~TRINITY_DN15546_c0_g1_i4.p1  ORF type:complete len:129 (-),score=16.49 TRINITY_DN15546_c0_g1_i4:10-396(-)